MPDRLRFRTFNEQSCHVPNRESVCHMNLRSVVENMYLEER